MWNYGEEIWCNLEGRYTHIIASQAHRPPGEIYDQDICQLAILGTIYERNTPLPSHVDIIVEPDTESLFTIEVEHIYP